MRCVNLQGTRNVYHALKRCIKYSLYICNKTIKLVIRSLCHEKHGYVTQILVI